MEESDRQNTEESIKDSFFEGIRENFSPENTKKTPVDFDSFDLEERQLLETETQGRKERYSKEGWEKDCEDIKRRIGLLIKAKGVNNINKKLINRDQF